MIPASWHSYPSIFNLGHKVVLDILKVPVQVEEKVDGSQFSWCVASDGDIVIRSKGATMHIDAPEKMFSAAAATVKAIAPLCHPDWTYRAEYLAKPKHNSLAYDRIPNNHLIVFDINRGHEDYLDAMEREAEAARLGLESVPVLYTGMVDGIETFRSFLDRVSILGGQKIEGVVVKPVGYSLFGPDKKVLMAKFVSEAFKEVHSREWKSSNPSGMDILTLIGAKYTTAARWSKAVQHLTERGELEGSPRDIGKLIPEIVADVEKECAEEIRDELWRWAWQHIRRSVTRGAPEWYKEQLLKSAFDFVEG